MCYVRAVRVRHRIIDVLGRIRVLRKLALILGRRGRAHAVFVNALFRARCIVLGGSINVFYSFIAISPSTTRHIFFRWRGLLRLSGCRRLQVRKGEEYSRVRTRGSRSWIQAATEMERIEGQDK